MTSRPPPLTSSTLSKPSVNTSRNSISELKVEKNQANNGCLKSYAFMNDERWPIDSWDWQRIQFSSPSVFRGGPGMLSSTNRASWDLFTITSFSFTAVCIRRTLDWSLEYSKRGEGSQIFVLIRNCLKQFHSKFILPQNEKYTRTEENNEEKGSVLNEKQ